MVDDSMQSLISSKFIEIIDTKHVEIYNSFISNIDVSDHSLFHIQSVKTLKINNLSLFYLMMAS